jgi:hypothetical protein
MIYDAAHLTAGRRTIASGVIESGTQSFVVRRLIAVSDAQ